MKYLVIDIETEVVGEQPSINDELKLLVWKDDAGNKGYYTCEQLYEIQQLVSKNFIFIGYNIKGYDIPILERYGCSFNYKIIIDEYEVIKKHLDKIKILKELDSLSLDSVAHALQLSHKKQEGFDYNLLKGKLWADNLPTILSYAYQDIEVEHDLFKWLEYFFEPFKYGLTVKEIETYKHITLRTSVYAYKVICRKAGIKDDYNDIKEDYKGQYEGGFVAEPSEEFVTDEIYEADLSSAYPHAFMQANLFSNDCKCCQEHEKYDGKHIFQLKGKYCSKSLGLLEKVIRELYLERLKFKKEGNRVEYALKILINVIYGICGNPAFKNVYNLNRVSDCTYIVRTTIQFIRNELEKNGYKLLYSDTDSVFIQMMGHSRDELDATLKLIMNSLKTSMAFPQDTFNMPIEKQIKLMYFPKKMKKNYLYVTADGKLVIKGLKIIKSNNQQVSRVVFEKYIKPVIVNELRVKFTGDEIRQWIDNELKADINLATIRIKATNKEYKNDGQINNQVFKQYGAGVHKLIPNFRKGVGYGVRICTVKEFQDAGLDILDINVQQAYNELQIFCDEPLICHTKVKLGGKKRFVNTLERWLR
jgi:DNA polymerase elongation subunit (family B)